MKIMIIGGSYFYGRVCVMELAQQHKIMVVNRGTYSMEEFGVRQVRGDRRDAGLWERCEENYDVVIDFCAYGKGDIAQVMNHLAGHVSQYIFISTVDVYERGTGAFITEGAPLETRTFAGDAGDYISGKVALEQELRDVCGERDTACTVLRPAILYGPFNYAPRESVFIQLMVQKNVLPVITDAEGKFQFVYVKDAVEAVRSCLLNGQSFGNAYNICNSQLLDYTIFGESLRQASDTPVEIIRLSVSEAAGQGVPLPFPVEASETEMYSSEKSVRELGLCYTGIDEGMRKTYRAFRSVFSA